MAQLRYDSRPSRYGPAPVAVPGLTPTLTSTIGGFGAVPSAPGTGLVGGMTFGGVPAAINPVIPTGPAAAPMTAPVISTANMPPVMGPPMSAMNPAASAATAAADVTKGAGFFGEDGFNIGDVGKISDIIGSFGSIWGAIQTNKLAKQEMAFQKEAYGTNLRNSLASYNTALTDRTNARHTQMERSPQETAAYIAAHQLRA